MNRRSFLKATLAASLGGMRTKAQNSLPNIVIILADDLGYGDLGCYGADIPTPNLDGMAADGVRFGQFYSASPVCSPARAALMTGRYPTRVGVPRVLFPGDKTGLSLSEVTLPQMLKTLNYSTMCIGKWHLGSQPDYLPTKRGFDQYFGLPYSNDMSPLPLMRNADTVEQPPRLDTLTIRYTNQAIDFINKSAGSPFFLYLAHWSPHIPLAVSDNFKGKSGLGLYGDAVAELDWSVGQVLSALKANNIDDNTLVMFTSDNGPWYQGSAGKLRGRKGETYEGGMRVPFIARWPGRIPSGRTTQAMATMMDFFPTLARLTGAGLPAPMDGVDIFPLFTGESDAVDRDPFLYFDAWNLQCARVGRWKLHVSRYNSVAWGPDPPGGRLNLPLPRPELYDLEEDPEEGYDLAADNPQIVADIRSKMVDAVSTFPAEVQNAWRDTMSQNVIGTPSGALPIKKA